MATKRLIAPERYKTTLQRFEEHLTAAGKQEAAEAVKSLIKGLKIAPTVDAVEVVHGRWKYYRKQNIAVCTNCSFERNLDDNFGKAISCPNCGAKMDGERKDNENDYRH